METSSDLLNQSENTSEPARPDFLKILCILSFIACGLTILACGLGSLTLSMSQDSIEEIWPQVSAQYPQLEEVNGVDFFQAVGIYCLIALFINIISLIGVIMMWRLEKMGFWIYVAAELSMHFFSIHVENFEQDRSVGGLVLSIAIDLVFIVLYFMNLKHMKGKTAIQ
ncbi:MAG TPA: hypothetical protein PLQ93_13390 [Bacteroidia bacterium]|nr:hypothetical protein [Bacteroidia bacterium]